MNKTILVMAIAATLILGTIALGSASAFTYGKVTWTVKKEPFSCETLTGGDCGGGKLSNKVSLVTTEPGQGISTGVGKASFSFKGTNGDITGKTIQLKSNNIQFQYDEQGNSLIASGTAKAKNGNFWNVEMVGTNLELNGKGKKGTIDLGITLESQVSGIKIKQQAPDSFAIYDGVDGD